MRQVNKMIFKNEVLVDGRIIKIKETENAAFISVLVKEGGKTNCPRFRVTKEQLGELKTGDHVSVSAELYERTVRDEVGNKKFVTGIKVNAISKSKSISEEMGVPSGDYASYKDKNIIKAVGYVNYVHTYPSGKTVLSVSLPARVTLIDFNRKGFYQNIKPSDFVCIVGRVQTKDIKKLNENKDNAEVNGTVEDNMDIADNQEVQENISKKHYKNNDSYVITQIEKAGMDFDKLLKQ